jgi:hypothetical protein
MHEGLIVSAMCTVKRTPVIFIGLLSLATFAAAAISNVSSAKDIADGLNSSSERTGKMTGIKPANVLADIAREMVMRSTTNSQVGKLINIYMPSSKLSRIFSTCYLKIKQNPFYVEVIKMRQKGLRPKCFCFPSRIA